MDNHDGLTTAIIKALQSGAKLSARDIARELRVTRKDVNSRLYSHVDVLFAREGTDPPMWSLFVEKSKSQSFNSGRRTPSSVMNSSGLEERRRVSDEDLTNLARKLLGSEDIQFRANGVNVEVSLAAMSLSDPYFAFEVLDTSAMQVVINTTSVPQSLFSDKEYLFGHLVHCVADAFVFRVVEQSGSSMDREDLYQFKNRVLLQLGFDPKKDPFS